MERRKYPVFILVFIPNTDDGSGIWVLLFSQSVASKYQVASNRWESASWEMEQGGALEADDSDELEINATGAVAAQKEATKVPFAFSKCSMVTKSGSSAYRAECGICGKKVSYIQ